MTFNAASRLRSLEDRSAALGSRRCELPGMHSVPTSAVLPYASGLGGLSRRLLNIVCCFILLIPNYTFNTFYDVLLNMNMPYYFVSYCGISSCNVV